MASLRVECSLTHYSVNGGYMARPRGNYKERFLERIVKTDAGCHEWQGQIKRDGYGRFCYQAKMISAHRAAYLLLNGAIPDGLLVLHHCDNRKCVNPEHLYLGNHQDNAKDMVHRGRAWGRRKPDDKQVEEILRLGSLGFSQQKIADKMKLHQTTISRILLGKNAYARKLMN